MSNKLFEVYASLHNQICSLGLNPFDPEIKYLTKLVGCQEVKQRFDTLADVAFVMTSNDYVAQDFKLYAKNTVCISVGLSIDRLIATSAYDLLKETKDKTSKDYKDRLDYALINGHVTFKQYNELVKEVN